MRGVKKVTVGDILNVIGEVDRPAEPEFVDELKEQLMDWDAYKIKIVSSYKKTPTKYPKLN